MNNRYDYLKKVKRIVIKIGSNSLTTNYEIDKKKINKVIKDISTIINSYQIIIVSSGAVAAGSKALGLHHKLKSIPEKQASASIGQINLMNYYKHYFSKIKKTVAQILLTENDLSDRKKYLNAKNAIEVLLKNGIIPIINENDTVGISEIIFGDNDMLSALIANLVDADLLIILSDVDGLIDFKNNTIIKTVNRIDKDIRNLIHTKKSKEGKGGMESKLKAMETILNSGKLGIIANSKTKNILQKIMNSKEVGTFFVNTYNVQNNKKHKKIWIKYSSISKGKLFIDKGAENALYNNKSLLATGIYKIEGNFDRGDIVNIYNEKNKLIAKGITNYDSYSINKIKGKKSSEFEKVLGIKLNNEIVHKDNIVIE